MVSCGLLLMMSDLLIRMVLVLVLVQATRLCGLCILDLVTWMYLVGTCGVILVNVL